MCFRGIRIGGTSLVSLINFFPGFIQISEQSLVGLFFVPLMLFRDTTLDERRKHLEGFHTGNTVRTRPRPRVCLCLCVSGRTGAAACVTEVVTEHCAKVKTIVDMKR